MEVKISVIMGVYQPRSRQILFQAVLSICSQTFSDWELIMVDDGTHGEGRDWIDQASLLDARIRLIRLPRHKGLSTALNAAIAASRGSYIARMDADDLSAPHRLQRLYDFLQAHAQYAWAGCCCRLVDEDGAWGHVRVPREPCARDFLPHSPYIHPSVMFRAHALADGYCEVRSIGRSEDYELFMRLHAAGLQGANVQEYLYLYREDRNSYHRRSFPHALREARTRGKGFAALGLPSLSALPYVVKPLFVAMTPPRLHWRIKQRRYADDIMRFRRVMARMALMAVRTDSMKRLDQYAYAVFGPVLCGFVIWVLKEAQRRGIRTLYFLSRDGWMMAEAAKRLCGALGVRMEIRYLYCSRLSLHRSYAHIDMEKALRLLSDEIPHGIAVTIEKMTERKNGMMDIEATIICERDSHKGIIIGKGGAMLKRIGSAARREIEDLMDTQVNLQIWVKVRKEWRDSELYMKNYGYNEKEI